jgi:hypothetical protein
VGTIREDRSEKEPDASDKNETYENSTEKIHRVTETRNATSGKVARKKGLTSRFSNKV